MEKYRLRETKNAGWTSVSAILILLFLMAAGFTGCADKKTEANDIPEIDGLKYESTVETDFAEGFDIYHYSDGYQIIRVRDEETGKSTDYLLVPEGAEVPEDPGEGVVVLRKPLDHIYLAASASMALISAIDGLDSVAFSATEEQDWYIEEAREAMEKGDIKYAGKYSQPDYEMLLDEGADLAVESTMIMHPPAVQEKLEEIDIPVFIDQSSYESHPLGRSEWIRVYGAMLDREEAAQAFFDDQKKVISELEGVKNTGKTVAFFYMNSQDQAIVRASDDYIPKMIEIAGGEYIFRDLRNPNDESRSAVVKLSMEEFYEQAADADYLIYNASIESPLTSIDDLKDKSPLFSKFKAVRNDNVWTTDKYLYQATDIMGQLIEDMHIMLNDSDGADMTFLKKVPRKAE